MHDATRTLALRALAVLVAFVLVAPVAAVKPARADTEVWSGRSRIVGQDSLPDFAHPVTSVAADPRTGGYWLAAGDGGVFAFGGAAFFGSAGGLVLGSDVVGIAAAPDGLGYWLATANGAVLAFGSASYAGSLSNLQLAAPIVSIVAAPDGRGYWMLGSDGGIFAFGSAGFFGSASGWLPTAAADLVATKGGDGYWVVGVDGRSYAFAGAWQLAAPTPRGTVIGASRGNGGIVIGWDSGVVDRVRSRAVDRTALVTLYEAVDVDFGVDGPIVATTGDRVRRLGPSVGFRGLNAVGQFADASSAQVGVVSFYTNFVDDRDLPIGALDRIHSDGAIPFITWEPWDPDQDLRVQPDFQLRDIIDGSHDGLIWRWATQAASYDKPLMIRFAHEMNGDWYPWSEAVNGNRPGEFVAAWRHIHEIFEVAGADNVTWVWNPNVETPWSLPLAGLFPGHDVVDMVAIDGYNAGTALPWGGWRSAESILGWALADLRAAAPGLPVIIGETASTESGGDKAGWIRDMFSWLDSDNPDISMVIWFDEPKETAWWVGSSQWSALSFAEAGADRWCGCLR